MECFSKYWQVILNTYELCELTVYDLNLRKKLWILKSLGALIFQVKFYLEFWVYIFFFIALIKHCDVKYVIFLIQ